MHTTRQGSWSPDFGAEFILGPKFGPIPNAKKYLFPPIPDKKSQFDKKKMFFGFVFLVIYLYLQNILLHIYNFTEE